MDVKLKVNDVEVTLGVNSICDMVYNLPEGEEYYELLHQFTLSNISSIREKIADKNCLAQKSVEVLLKDKNSSVLENIVRSDCAKEYISDSDIDHILEVGDENCIENLINYLDDYENVNQLESVKKIMKLNNHYLLLKLAENWNTPKQALKSLSEHFDPDISKAAKNTLDDC